MNRYTLRFRDSSLEQLYIADGIKTQFIVTFTITVLLILFFILTIIQRLVDDEDNIRLYAGLLVYLAISLSVVKVRQQYSEYSLCVLCLVIFLPQLSMNKFTEPQVVFVLAYNFATLQCVIMFIIQFKFAFLTNTLVTGLRLYYASMNTEVPYKLYIFTLLAYIVLTVGMYWKDRHSRFNYLLKLKDQQWQYLLPRIVDNTFYTFVFNEEYLRFELQMGNTDVTQEEFIQFIRDCKVGNLTLENYIVNQYKQLKLLESCVSLNNQGILRVQYKGRHCQIRYCEFFVTEPHFMIVKESDNIVELKHKCKVVNKQQLRNFNGFINQMMDFRRNSNNSAESILRNMYLAMFQFQCRLWLIAGKIIAQPVSCARLFNRCLSLVPHANIKILMDEDFDMVTIKPLFVLMMVEVLNSLKCQHLSIRIKSNLETITICCKGELMIAKLYDNPIFNKAISMLMIRDESTNESLMFKMPLELDISYLTLSQRIN